MRLHYSGIDWETAGLDRREAFGLTTSKIDALSSAISVIPGICGCVILSTCNRTEIYLTMEDEYVYEPAFLLCGELGLSYVENSCSFHHLEEEDVVRHLMEVACGLRSQILGEDQIITQVKNAMNGAREAKSSDSVMQTLFRLAVTAGKEVKSKVKLGGTCPSVADRAVKQIKNFSGALAGKRAVVIGNGEMGRVAATLLVMEGCTVTVTLRSYRHGVTIVPKGCNTVAYDRRMEIIDGSDLLISATKSPHYTVTETQIQNLSNPPALIADLSMPRDIENAVRLLPNIHFWDLDDIKSDEDETLSNTAALSEVQGIIEKHTEAFYKWLNYKNALVHEGKL